MFTAVWVGRKRLDLSSPWQYCLSDSVFLMNKRKIMCMHEVHNYCMCRQVVLKMRDIFRKQAVLILVYNIQNYPAATFNMNNSLIWPNRS